MRRRNRQTYWDRMAVRWHGY